MAPEPYRASEDTVLLAKALECIDGSYRLAGEIGCGTGFITEVLSSMAEEVVSSDIDVEAARETWSRAKRKGFDWKVHVVCCDRLEAIREGEVFQLTAFNPPYLPGEEEDAATNGGPSGVEIPLSFLESAVRRLARNGLIVLLLSSLSDWLRALEELTIKGFRASVLCAKSVGIFEDLLVVVVLRSAPRSSSGS
jgi:HemK-related putative methylase